jgi:hypothetical protein
MNYLDSLSANVFTFIISITSLLIGLFVSPLLDLVKTKFVANAAAADKANRLKQLLNIQLNELLDIFKMNRVVHEKSSLKNKLINNFVDAHDQYKDLGGPVYQLNINSEFNDKGIYKRLLSTIHDIEQTNYHGWPETSEKLLYLKRLNHAIECAVKTPRSYCAEDVLKIASDFQNADAPRKNIFQRAYIWLSRK